MVSASRLQLHRLALAHRRHQFALHADAGAGGDLGDLVLRHHAGIENDLQVHRRGPVVELYEVDVLAVAAGLHPSPGGDALSGGAFQQAPYVAVWLNHCDLRFAYCSSKPVENLAGRLQQVRVVAAILQLQHQRKLVFARCAAVPSFSSSRWCRLRRASGNRWLSSLPLLSCTWVERIRLFHQVEFVLHARADVGVARIEHVVHAHVGQFLEHDQLLGARKLVGNVLQQNLHAAPAGEQVEFLERAPGGVELAHVELFAAHADVLDQVLERNRFGNLQGPLDLVHHVQPRALHRLGDGDHGVRSGTAPDLVVVHRRVQRVQLQIGIAEPVAQFGDLRLIAIIQVLARAENLYRGDSGVLNFSEQRGCQPVIDEQMRGQYVIHRVPSVSSSIRTACRKVYAPRCNPSRDREGAVVNNYQGHTLVSFRRSLGTGIRARPPAIRCSTGWPRPRPAR